MKRKRDSKKIIATVLAVILVFAMIFSLVAPFFAAEINNNITIDAKIGFEQKYKIGANVPISIFLKNDGQNFSGELQVKILQGKNGLIEEYCIYAKTLELPQGATKNIEFDVSLVNLQKTIEISLVQNEKVIASEIANCKVYSPDDTIVAVLTDTKENLNFLKTLKIRNGLSENKDTSESQINYESLVSLNDALIFIDETSFPKNKETFANFNAIIIDNYDTSRLSAEQLSSLESWIDGGGILILGTGANRDKVMKGLNTNISENANVKILASDSFGESEFSNLIKDEHSQLIEKGNGKVLIHSFELGTAPFTDNNASTEFLSKLYLNVLPITYNIDFDSNNRIYNLNDILRYVPVDDSNFNVKIIFALILIYIIILGPVLYILLKKKDRLEKAWIIMPCLAFGLTLVIYGISFSTPYKKSILNSVSLIRFQNASNKADIYTALGILSPERGDIDVRFDKNINIVNYGISNVYNNANSFPDSNSETQQDIKYKILLDDKPTVEFYKNTSWDLNSLNLKSDKILGDGIDISLYVDNTDIKGKVTNNTDCLLEDGVLMMGNLYYAYYDYIEAGETKEVSLKTVSESGKFDIVEAVFPQNYNSIKEQIDKGTLTKEKVRNNKRRASLLYSIVDNIKNKTVLNNGNYIIAPININFYAFNTDFLVDISAEVNNKKATSFNTNIFVTDATIDYAKSKSFDLPQGIVGISNIYSEEDLNISEGRFSIPTIYMYSSGDIDCTFKIPENTVLDAFQIYWLNSHTGKNTIQIYNTISDQWEELNDSEYIKPDDYIKDNKIQVKLKIRESSEFQLPTISVNGHSN